MALRDDRDPMTESGPEAAVSPRRGWRRFVLPLGGAFGAAGLAFVFAGILRPARPDAPPIVDPREASLDRIWDLRGFAPAEQVEIPVIKITLADENHDGYARLELVIEFRAKDPKAVRKAIIDTEAARIRNALNMHIAGKYAAELRGTVGMQVLALEMIDILDGILFPGLRNGKVVHILYDEFMVD